MNCGNVFTISTWPYAPPPQLELSNADGAKSTEDDNLGIDLAVGDTSVKMSSLHGEYNKQA